jgi:type II secretion system protein N
MELNLPAVARKVPLPVRRALAWSGYPVFYLACLGLFAYLTFPYDRVKERVIAELESQSSGPSAQRVEVDSLGPYWLGGIAARGFRIITPRPATEASDRPPSKLSFDKVHARVRLLPLLIGRVSVSFGAQAYGGHIDGVTYASSDGRRVEATLDGLDIGQFEPLGELLGGAPVTGTLGGIVDWVLPESKLSKATGTLALAIADLSIGDGKVKLAGKLALPRLSVGLLELSAEAKSGVLKIQRLAAQGQDLDLIGEGRLVLRDAPLDSMSDLYLRFRFSDGYRNRSEMTKSLFGSPGSSLPALFELGDPRVKASKRPDGFYGWRMAGELKAPRFDASASGGSFGTGAPGTPAPGGARAPGN